MGSAVIFWHHTAQNDTQECATFLIKIYKSVVSDSGT